LKYPGDLLYRASFYQVKQPLLLRDCPKSDSPLKLNTTLTQVAMTSRTRVPGHRD
jgi:hypothetical protein